MFKALTACTFLFVFTGATMAEPISPAAAANRAEIIQTVDAIGYFADRRDWEAVKNLFHPDGAVIDYLSYVDGAIAFSAAPAAQSPESIVATWKRVLPGFDMTQHVVSNHQVAVEGDKARVLSTIHAVHVLDGDSWTYLGDYEHELAWSELGWRVTLMRANMRGQLGDTKLAERAITRVADSTAP